MLHTTRGIVLKTVRHNDKTIIANLYTEHFGLRAYVVYGGRGKKSSGKTVLLQALNCVEISAFQRSSSRLADIRELQAAPAFTDIPFNSFKTSIALFMTEIIFKSVKEEEVNLELFDFLHRSILLLDSENASCTNFHLVFLAEFSKHLGFFPGNNYSESKKIFDLMEGLFVEHNPAHPYYLAAATAKYFSLITTKPLENHSEINISNEQRRELLSALVDYYRLHLQGMNEVKSHAVLEEVMQ